jgi:phospholipid transport system transporter-binding protein
MNKESLKIEGALNFESMPRVLLATAEYMARTDLPDGLSVDLSEVQEFDSSAVALLLHWRREAAKVNKMLRYINLPKNLTALAELYDVQQFVECPLAQAMMETGKFNVVASGSENAAAQSAV